MAYRDATAARRAQLDELAQLAEDLRERMTAALIERLKPELRNEMAERIRDAQRLSRPGPGGFDEAIEAHEKLVATLEQIIATAPKLARRYNRHPRRFPPEARPSHKHLFPDIYHRQSMAFRERVHGFIERLDPEARLFDRRQNYQMRVEHPYLVDACFRYRKAPLRLALMVQGDDMATFIDAYWALWVLLRPSAPDLHVYPQSFDDRILKMVRLRRDAEVGEREFDRHFIVDGTEEAADRIVHPEVQEHLNALRAHGPTLLIRDQCARLQWRVRNDHQARTLEIGIDAMVALRRRLKPALLLRAEPR